MWFISHLLETPAFWDNKECLIWSQRIMSLTSSDIVWYSHDYFYAKIIDRWGEFSNVPLLGTKGGISYNPVLARRQMRYPLNDKPGNLSVEGIFFMNEKDEQRLRKRIVHAWHNIQRKGREELGKKDCVAKKSYMKRVTDRAIKLKMSYPSFSPLSDTHVDSIISVTPAEDLEDSQVTCDQLKIERDEWKYKFHASDVEKVELLKQLKEKDELLLHKDVLLQHQKDVPIEKSNKKRRVQEDLFSSSMVPLHEYSNILATSGA
ncbi:uncharacterized protein LOC131613464 [Vicia villosa]|uniref:uncharacterized protein LOC131613464 n=1 Tax=Vicia villosa TaxID=3911 RepID=UPI00273AEBB7|nr:uncharacterized protein LOC131613464 [Vicia villosa]